MLENFDRNYIFSISGIIIIVATFYLFFGKSPEERKRSK
jgi:hypothetical protein